MKLPIWPITFLSLAPFATATDLFVAPSGGGDATTIQGAIDLAADGDVIIVLPGKYAESPVIDDLSVWIVAQQPGTAEVIGSLSVFNLNRRAHCVLSGMAFTGEPNPALFRQSPALFAQSTEGVLHLHDCHFQGARASTQNLGTGGPGALLIDAKRVIATGTDFLAGDGAEQSSRCTGSEGGPGLRAISSRFTAWGGAIAGGAGTSCGRTLPFTAGDGGVGLLASSSSIFLAAVPVDGGAGGEDLDFIPSVGGDGGDALEADAASFLILQSPVLVPGAAGDSLLGTRGLSGTMLSGNALIRTVSGRPRVHELVSLLPAGTSIPLVVRGRSGRPAALFGQAGPPPFVFDFLRQPGLATPLSLLPVGTSMIALGVIPSSGELLTSVSFPAPPAGQSSQALTAQVVIGRNLGASVLGSPLPVLVIDSQAFGNDCDSDGISDTVELITGSALDLDLNGIPDRCQPDCNGNGTPDFIDINTASSTDFNANGVPDECETPGLIHVDPAAAPGGDGSPVRPLRTLREGVDASISGGEIVLANGLYQTSDDRRIELSSRSLTIRSSGGPGACVIDMGGDGRAFRSINAVSGQGLFIAGITFQNGDVRTTTGVTGADEGGALFAQGSRVRIENCVFDSNAAHAGGALSLRQSFVRIENCHFEGNQQSGASGGGGAAHASGCELEIESCFFESNSAAFAGGALRLRPNTGDPTAVSRSRFFGNESAARAGAVAVAPLNSLGQDIVFLSQCVFAHNEAPIGGAIGGSGQSRTFMALCTLTENVGLLRAGGVAAQLGMDLISVNNVIWANTAPDGPQISVLGINSSAAISSSNLEGGVAEIEVLGAGSLTAAAGVINADPRFVNPSGTDGNPMAFADNDYRLAAGSPSIDAGNVAFITPDATDIDRDTDTFEPSPLDLDGNPRRRDDPAVADTGLGSSPLVDHGPFER